MSCDVLNLWRTVLHECVMSGTRSIFSRSEVPLVAISSTYNAGEADRAPPITMDNGAALIPSRPRALLVDDERSVLNALSRLLRRHGFDVDVETDPIVAIARLNDVPLDVIVSDFNMPNINGAQLLREARRRVPDCTRILLSGQADRDAVIGAVNDGAVYCYLDKPWDGPGLIQTL